MSRIFALLLIVFVSGSVEAQDKDAPAAPPADVAAPAPVSDTPPPAEPIPAEPVPVPQAPVAPPLQAQAGESQSAFDQYRRDLINLLALRADPEPLLAAAQLAWFDRDDKQRTARLKTPALLARAQKPGENSALVWWISAQLDCGTACPRKEDVQKLEAIAPDNGSTWLLAMGGEKDPARMRPLLTSMAQAKRFNDYWNENVLVLYHALEILPVPPDVLAHGVGSAAARLNFATSVSSGLVPPYMVLGRYCKAAAATDTDLISDCLTAAHLLETGGSFAGQAIGFDIEETLLQPGVQHDVMLARKRAIAWQIERFSETSARFARETPLTQSYLGFLKSEESPGRAALALLRSLNVSTDPPQGWQPANPLK
jgi:hypothetical protein